MIILDEQLLGRGLDTAISAWYPGSVHFITDLRPGTVIKDDAIPALLSRERQPTFVTLNESDFWQKVAITDNFCIVCFALDDSQSGIIPSLLRKLLRSPAFHTKALRMGRVVRITANAAYHYDLADATIRPITGWA